MKIRFILPGVMVAVLLFIVGCSPQALEATQPSESTPVAWWLEPSDATQRVVNCDSFMERESISEQLEIAMDDKLTILLCSNPATGFEWLEEARISNPAILRQTNHLFISPESEPPPPPGTFGMEQWTLEPLTKGNTFVYLEYSQPWEGGTKKGWTYSLIVTVK